MAPDGYAWWYLDALSDDGASGITVIAFIGSVFSPYYALARRRRHGRGGADPLAHCAINVAFQGRGGQRWTMTERGGAEVERDASTLRIGPSQLQWRDDRLRIEIDEVTVPWPTRVRGHVTVHAPRLSLHEVELVPGQRWCAVAPRVRVEVELGNQRWQGAGYLDANRGDRPLERVFRRWDWSRAHLPDGSSVVLYDLEPLHGAPRQVALRFGRDGGAEVIEPPSSSRLPPTLWRISRYARSDAGTSATVLRTLTDAPFYARTLIDAHWLGSRVTAVHESLSLERFDRRWVQAMLPFRMPRIVRGWAHDPGVNA